MCDFGLVGLGIAIVSAAATGAQQHDNARKQSNYQSRLAKATEANAATAAESNYVAQLEQLNQVRSAASEESLAMSQDLAKTEATLTVGAETRGLQGGVVTDLRTSLAVQAASDAAIATTNLSWQENQILAGVAKIRSDQQSRINSAAPGPVSGMNYGQILGTLGQGIGANAQYQASQGNTFFGSTA